jgi:small-conductance mechanosensitive channel
LFTIAVSAKENAMWIVAVAWIYVVGLMALTERSIVAGIMTFLGYCVLPLSILYYLSGSKRRHLRNEAQARLRASKTTDKASNDQAATMQQLDDN